MRSSQARSVALELLALVVVGLLVGCEGGQRGPVHDLYIVLDTSGSLPESSRSALEEQVHGAVADGWAMKAAPDSSASLWGFTSDPTYPVQPLFRFTLTRDKLPPPVIKSRQEVQRQLTDQIANALGPAEFGTHGSPIAESIGFIAQSTGAAGNSADLVVISDFLQTSPDGAAGGVEFTESYPRQAADEQLLTDLQGTGARNSCLRHALLVSTYGISNLETRRSVPPDLQQRALAAFRSWLEWLGRDVQVRTVLPSAPDTASGSAEAQGAGGGGHGS